MNIAVIGASGLVGREIIESLQQRFPETNLSLYASHQSQGKTISFNGNSLPVEIWEPKATNESKFVFLCVDKNFSLTNADYFRSKNTLIIDNSSAFRMKESVPLVVPEINGALIKGKESGFIANPNCATIQMALTLEPMRQNFGLKKVIVSTYQSVSGIGQRGIDELGEQLKSSPPTSNQEHGVFPHPIADNILPYIGDNGAWKHCDEEIKIIRETRKIFNSPSLQVMATTARVPISHCHCEAITIELEEEISIEQAETTMTKAPGVSFDKDLTLEKIPTPRTCFRRNEVFVTRMKLLYGHARSNWLQYWTISDNLRKGAATNAVDILEAVLKKKETII